MTVAQLAFYFFILSGPVILLEPDIGYVPVTWSFVGESAYKTAKLEKLFYAPELAMACE